MLRGKKLSEKYKNISREKIWEKIMEKMENLCMFWGEVPNYTNSPKSKISHTSHVVRVLKSTVSTCKMISIRIPFLKILNAKWSFNGQTKINRHNMSFHRDKKEVFLDPFRSLGDIIKYQRRFASKGGRITPELVASFTGICRIFWIANKGRISLILYRLKRILL